MFKPKDPKDLVVALLARSPCSVQVASVLADNFGIYSWGWNSTGSDGYGEHAEAACLRRANRARLATSTLYVAAKRAKSGNIVTAKPCPSCQKRVAKVGKICYRDGEGVWKEL